MKRIGMYLDEDVILSMDEVRGMIPRSRFVCESVKQKVEEIKKSGSIVGQI